MDAQALYDNVSIRCSRLTTRAYSTSFSLGIRCLNKRLRDPIYAIYGFVRFGDEIVDTFHTTDKVHLLNKFRHDTFEAIEQGISLNPILHSFQKVVNQYGIDRPVIEQFLKSMEMDITMTAHDQASYEEYILGSAEVVGLMCLRVFCNGDAALYEQLKPQAMKLGSAFQKINFLRDLNADFNGMGRMYFPGVDLSRFDQVTKRLIEKDIAADFQQGLEGILRLPRSSRFGVYMAYVYYQALLRKIMNTPAHRVVQSRIRIRNRHKIRLLFTSFIRHRLNLIG
ncbi:MAG: phytoene/squalene synthase family protein [Bacteroidota bacterium]